MIKIEMSFESGAQAREEMFALLYSPPDCFEGERTAPSLQEMRSLTTANAMDFGAVEDRVVAAALAAGELRQEAAPEAEPAKRTRRTKAQIAADEAEAEARAKAEAAGLTETDLRMAADEGGDPNTPPTAIYAHRAAEYLAANPGTTPLQHMKAELINVNDKFGLDEVRKLMVDFGIPRIGEVPVEKYPALLAVIDKRLEA